MKQLNPRVSFCHKRLYERLIIIEPLNIAPYLVKLFGIKKKLDPDYVVDKSFFVKEQEMEYYIMEFQNEYPDCPIIHSFHRRSDYAYTYYVFKNKDHLYILEKYKDDKVLGNMLSAFKLVRLTKNKDWLKNQIEHLISEVNIQSEEINNRASSPIIKNPFLSFLQEHSEYLTDYYSMMKHLIHYASSQTLEKRKDINKLLCFEFKQYEIDLLKLFSQAGFWDRKVSQFIKLCFK